MPTTHPTEADTLAAVVAVRIPFLSWARRAALEISVSASIAEGLRLRAAVEIAVRDRAVLRDADLSGADLRDADLSGAVLRDAVLSGADLRGADLSGADLRGAVLSDAVLSGADLRGADLSGAVLRDAVLRGADLRGAVLSGAVLSDAVLRGAVLSGAKLVGDRPIFIQGPLGRESRYLTAYLTDQGVHIRTGCFFGDIERFRAAVVETHGESVHAREYAAAVQMIEAHFAAWPAPTPAPDEPASAEAA